MVGGCPEAAHRLLLVEDAVAARTTGPKHPQIVGPTVELAPLTETGRLAFERCAAYRTTSTRLVQHNIGRFIFAAADAEDKLVRDGIAALGTGRQDKSGRWWWLGVWHGQRMDCY